MEPERPIRSRAVDPGAMSVDQMLAVIVDLTRKVEALEFEVERAELRVAEPEPGEVLGDGDAIVARAEQRAYEIATQAQAAASRVRGLAAERGREIIIQAKRDALEMVKAARVDADRIVTAVRYQESALWERVQTLQAVVRRTERLLREVAEVDHGGANRERFEPSMAAELATLERRRRSADPTADLPPAVRELLGALRRDSHDGHAAG